MNLFYIDENIIGNIVSQTAREIVSARAVCTQWRDRIDAALDKMCDCGCGHPLSIRRIRLEEAWRVPVTAYKTIEAFDTIDAIEMDEKTGHSLVMYDGGDVVAMVDLREKYTADLGVAWNIGKLFTDAAKLFVRKETACVSRAGRVYFFHRAEDDENFLHDQTMPVRTLHLGKTPCYNGIVFISLCHPTKRAFVLNGNGPGEMAKVKQSVLPTCFRNWPSKSLLVTDEPNTRDFAVFVFNEETNDYQIQLLDKRHLIFKGQTGLAHREWPEMPDKMLYLAHYVVVIYAKAGFVVWDVSLGHRLKLHFLGVDQGWVADAMVTECKKFLYILASVDHASTEVYCLNLDKVDEEPVRILNLVGASYRRIVEFGNSRIALYNNVDAVVKDNKFVVVDVWNPESVPDRIIELDAMEYE